MSLVAKVLCAFVFLGMIEAANAKDVHVLILGEDAAANCNAHVYGQVKGVYQLTLDGVVKPASDPFESAECSGGSIWMPLGERMTKARGGDRIIFFPIAVMHGRARDYLLGGRAAKKLEIALAVANKQNITFDYALWYQGFADAGSSYISYSNTLRSLLKYVSMRVKVSKWLISRTGACGPGKTLNVEKAQIEIAKQPVLNRFAGADDTVLRTEYRSGDCSLTSFGQERMADLWFDAIGKADTDSMRYQKESLLYYFK
jgi:hypothetical protein